MDDIWTVEFHRLREVVEERQAVAEYNRHDVHLELVEDSGHSALAHGAGRCDCHVLVAGGLPRLRQPATLAATASEPELTQFNRPVRIIFGERDPYLNVHEARHTAATWLDHAGVSPKVASQIMGHKTPDYQPGAAAITLRRYTPTLPGELERARDLLDQFLASRAQLDIARSR